MKTTNISNDNLDAALVADPNNEALWTERTRRIEAGNAERLRVDAELEAWLVAPDLTVKLTGNQIALITGELDRTEGEDRMLDLDEMTIGRTFVRGTQAAFDFIAEGIGFTEDDDLQMLIEGGGSGTITDAQVAFGVKAMRKSIDTTVAKLTKGGRS